MSENKGAISCDVVQERDGAEKKFIVESWQFKETGETQRARRPDTEVTEAVRRSGKAWQ